MKKKYLTLLFFGLIALITGLSFSSCDDDDDDDNGPNPIVYWRLYLNPQSQVPAVIRPETGVVTMQLWPDNRLSYSIKVNSLVSGDQLTAAHFHTGDPLTNGPIVVDLDPTFVDGSATGTVTLRESFVDSLLNLSNQIYFNVHSTQYPTGLVRGQVNSDIIYAADVNLTGANEVPPVVTTATGTAFIRLTTERKLYSHVSVANLESADALTAAHIRLGATGTNGDIAVTLASALTDFGVNKVNTLTPQEITTLFNSSTYVNVNTTLHPTGVVRGQLINGIASPPVVY